MEVRHRKHDPQVLAKIEQNSQQGHGIGPSRDGNGHAVSGLE
jgi:hypothetical protein